MKKFLLLLFAPCFLNAQNQTAEFDMYMKGQAELYGFNGNVLVAKNGNVIYRKSFGYADFHSKKRLDDNSVFDCGSIAKEFTAVGILLLKDQGKLNYTDTLRKFFPELPFYNVTIQQLLTHTSGVPNGFGLIAEKFDHKKIARNKDLLRLLASEKPPFLFEPGTSLMYSGTGFNLLACIIEKISGQSYNDYMEEHVFKPLNLKHTRVANGPRSPQGIPGFAYGYEYSDSLRMFVRNDELKSGWTTYLSGITGEGMIVTTADDLLKWDRSLEKHLLLSESTQKEMLSIQAERTVVPIAKFGYGMIVGTNDLGKYNFHNGYYPGYVSMHLHYIDDDVTAIVLSNNLSRSDFIANALSAIAMGKGLVMPYEHRETMGKYTPGKYAGKFTMQLTRPPFMAVFPIEFVEKNSQLFIHPMMGPDIELKAESDRKFFFADGTDQQIEFELDGQNQVTKVWQIAWGLRKEMKKI